MALLEFIAVPSGASSLDDFVAPRFNLPFLLDVGAVYVDGRRQHHAGVAPGAQWVRLHLEPRRYDVGAIDWRACVFFENEDFVVVDKPHGIPVHATLDNAFENVLVQMTKALKQPLFITQRLDVPTAGLFVLAKTTAYQRLFNRWLGEGRVQKRYRGLLEGPACEGLHRHHMVKNKYQPKILKDEPGPGLQICDLKVLACAPGVRGFDAEIELLTGRTHQIRAQLARLGAPLIGDALYGAKQTWTPNSLPLVACQLTWSKYDFRRTPTWEL